MPDHSWGTCKTMLYWIFPNKKSLVDADFSQLITFYHLPWTHHLWPPKEMKSLGTQPYSPKSSSNLVASEWATDLRSSDNNIIDVIYSVRPNLSKAKVKMSEPQIGTSNLNLFYCAESLRVRPRRNSWGGESERWPDLTISIAWVAPWPVMDKGNQGFCERWVRRSQWCVRLCVCI